MSILTKTWLQVFAGTRTLGLYKYKLFKVEPDMRDVMVNTPEDDVFIKNEPTLPELGNE